MNIKKGDVFVKNEESLEVIKIAGNVLILSPMDEVNGVGVLRFLTEAQLNEFGYELDRGICGGEGGKIPEKCGCGFAWGHSGKHARGVVIGVDMGKESILDRTVYAVPKVARWCEHGTDLNYFCEDCDGAKITEGIDRDNDLGLFKGKKICEMNQPELLDFARWVVKNMVVKNAAYAMKCDHTCSSNCRREGCNCACGSFHDGE